MLQRAVTMVLEADLQSFSDTVNRCVIAPLLASMERKTAVGPPRRTREGAPPVPGGRRHPVAKYGFMAIPIYGDRILVSRCIGIRIIP